MKPALLILAAGIGSRYGGFKQIDPIGPGGEIPLDYAVYDAWRAGFGRVVFVIRPELQQPIQDHFAGKLDGRLQVDYVVQRMDDLPAGYQVPAERKKPWGTGHAVLSARHAIHEPFASINADDFYGPASYRALAEFLRQEQNLSPPYPYAMVGFFLRNTLSPHGSVSRGICQEGPAGYLHAVEERTRIELRHNGIFYLDEQGVWQSLHGSEYASLNIWAFGPSIFACLEAQFAEFMTRYQADLKKEFFLPTVVDNLIKTGRCSVKILETTEHWFGMTYPEDRAMVQAGIRGLIAAGVYPEQLWQSITSS